MRNIEYLEKLLKHYTFPIDRNNMNMEENLILIHRIILKHSETSNETMVEQVEALFSILIENSVKIDNNTIIFKTLTYFIQNGFYLFITTLKSKKVTSKNKFIKQLLNILDSKEIAKSFNLNEADIEKESNISVLKKVIIKMDSKFKKIFCFPLFFLYKFIHENDEMIKDKINKYISQKDINKFYQTYNEPILEKKYDILKKIIESESNEDKNEMKKPKSNKEKNENKNNLIETDEGKENPDKDETKQNSDNSFNKEKDNNEKSEDSNKNGKIISDISENFNNLKENDNNSTKDNKIYSNEEIMNMVQSLTQRNEEEYKKIYQRFEEEYKKYIKDLKKNIKK